MCRTLRLRGRRPRSGAQRYSSSVRSTSFLATFQLNNNLQFGLIKFLFASTISRPPAILHISLVPTFFSQRTFHTCVKYSVLSFRASLLGLGWLSFCSKSSSIGSFQLFSAWRMRRYTCRAHLIPNWIGLSSYLRLGTYWPDRRRKEWEPNYTFNYFIMIVPKKFFISNKMSILFLYSSLLF